MPYASFISRLVAAFIDFLLVALPASVFGAFFWLPGSLFFYLLYAPFLESSAAQATIGKRIMGIKVTDLSGGTISIRTAFIRTIVRFLSGSLAFFPHLLALFTDKKQALHDIVAQTVVCEGSTTVALVDAWVEKIQATFSSHSESIAHPDVSSRPNSSQSDRFDQLERLHSLFEKGALSKEEYEKEKARLLN